MDKIAVLIPCYNEGLTIYKVVSDAKNALPDAKIYVYDNNSTDNTVEEASRAGAIIRYEHKQGKGNVVRTMFEQIDAECYIMVDGDDTYDVSAAPEMARRVLEDHDDMVVGDRLGGAYLTENKRPFHNLGNLLVRKSINFLFHTNIADMMTGFRAFSYEFVKTFPSKSDGFQTETEMSIFSAVYGLRLSSLTIGYRDRPAGSFSKLNTFKDGFKVLLLIFSLFRSKRSRLYFGIIAFILIALGVGFLIPVFITYFKQGNVPNFPTLIVCCFCILTGIIALFTGFILSALESNERNAYRHEYSRVHDEKKRKLENSIL